MAVTVFFLGWALAAAAGAPSNALLVDRQVAAAFPGWEIDERAEGDLNGDTLADLEVTLRRPDDDSSSKGADGQADRKAWLAVFFRTPDGKLRLQTKAARAVCIGCGGVKSDWSAVIGVPYVDAKGILALEYEGGSHEVWNMRFKWRYDKARDRFALVGETVQIRDTLSEDGRVERGSLSYEDINYLSGKMIRKLGGKPEQKCAVKPGIAVLDLAAFDFEKFCEIDEKSMAGSCGK